MIDYVTLGTNDLAKVRAFYDEGAPGMRGDPAMNFYAGYFRDPDGNKLAAFHMAAA